ncbi:MAG: purine-nucleoside phosphorylase [Epsilonproteobacteria bacterium]|nr:purine-nucleoside phosphorylase [Campylobacterota bacterium]
MIISAGDIESFHFATPIGIGLVDSAINLTKICIESRPDSITFIGSCGSYGRLNIFDIVDSTSAYNIESSLFKLNSYSPIENRAGVSSKVSVNSSNYITTRDDISREYLSIGIDIENMEFYSVLKVAEKFNIPAKGVFIVTNYCNGDAHRDFLKNHKKSMKLLIEYIEREL